MMMYIHYVPHSKQNSCHSVRACVFCFHPSPLLSALKDFCLQQRQSFACQCHVMFRLNLLGLSSEELDGAGVQFEFGRAQLHVVNDCTPQLVGPQLGDFCHPPPERRRISHPIEQRNGVLSHTVRRSKILHEPADVLCVGLVL